MEWLHCESDPVVMPESCLRFRLPPGVYRVETAQFRPDPRPLPILHRV